MNEKALSTLEYDKIIEMLTSRASSPLGKSRCEDLVPSSSLGEIEYRQQQTQDALTRLFQKGNLSFGSVKDVRGSLKLFRCIEPKRSRITDIQLENIQSTGFHSGRFFNDRPPYIV